MKKNLFLTVMVATFFAVAHAETIEPIAFGNFESWTTRNLKESALLGGKKKVVYEIGPNTTIDGNKAYTNQGGSPWGTSNVYARVAGVVKASNAVFPETRGNGKCAKLTTIYEHVKAIGIINMDVLVTGSIFLGEMKEPVSSTKSPYSKMEMGIPFTKRPKYLQFDYKLVHPGGDRIYSSGFGKKKTIPGIDHAEVFVLLQRRWEDEKGGLHAARVGTGRERYGASTSGWVNNHRIKIMYGDITSDPGYKSFMGLVPKEKSYFAKNSKGKMVPVVEEQWDDANATPTHIVLMASTTCGTAFVGTVGMELCVDNFALVY